MTGADLDWLDSRMTNAELDELDSYLDSLYGADDPNEPTTEDEPIAA